MQIIQLHSGERIEERQRGVRKRINALRCTGHLYAYLLLMWTLCVPMHTFVRTRVGSRCVGGSPIFDKLFEGDRVSTSHKETKNEKKTTPHPPHLPRMLSSHPSSSPVPNNLADDLLAHIGISAEAGDSEVPHLSLKQLRVGVC
jgi:hypothetical protein